MHHSPRPVTIIKSRCLPAEVHELFDPDRGPRAQIAAAHEVEINKIIPPGGSQTFSFLRTKDGGFVLAIFWQSNSAVIFSKIPLLMGMTQKRWERLLRAD